MKRKNKVALLCGGMALVLSGCLAGESKDDGALESVFGEMPEEGSEADAELSSEGDTKNDNTTNEQGEEGDESDLSEDSAPSDLEGETTARAAGTDAPDVHGEVATDAGSVETVDANAQSAAESPDLLGQLDEALANDRTPEEDTSADDEPLSARELIEQSVFRIEATGTFATPLSSETTAVAGGTGFLIDDQGHALTNAHVVSGATLLRVSFPGEVRERNARVLALAECSDLALMKVDGVDGEFAHLNWSQQLAELGANVLAVGYPLGGDITLTNGIVSKSSTSAHTDWASVDDVIEHTATINPGSSGGPLLNTDYQVIGINYAGSEFDQYYAIGQGEAAGLVEQLMAGNDVHTIGLTGVAASDGNESGIWVFAVKAGSPADRVGIEAGDLITHFGNLPLLPDSAGVITMEDYCDILRSHGEGAAIDVRLVRWATGETWEGQVNGRELSRVSLGTAPEPGSDPESMPETEPVTGDPFVAEHSAGSIVLGVLPHWSDVGSFTHTRFDDVVGHALIAAPDSEAFSTYYSEPGVSVSAWRDVSLSAEDLLAVYSYAAECSDSGGAGSIAVGSAAGVYEIHSGCQGASSVVTQVALEASDHTALLVHQSISEGDVEGLELALSTLEVVVPNLP